MSSSLGANPSAYVLLQAERLEQVQRKTVEDITEIIQAMRAATTLPRLRYHFARHGQEFGVASEEEYVSAFHNHLARPDLRIFTYLRTSDRAPMWELVAPGFGEVVVYNERERRVWSFFRPRDPGGRYENSESWWLEVKRAGAQWHFEDQWIWQQP